VSSKSASASPSTGMACLGWPRAVRHLPVMIFSSVASAQAAQSELGRVWQATKDDPKTWAFWVPAIVGVGAAAYLAGTRLEPVKSLGTTGLPIFKNSVAVPWMPALKIDWSYDSTINNTLTDPLHPKRFDIGLQVDVMQLIRDIRK
jgi:hypothetical protein